MLVSTKYKQSLKKDIFLRKIQIDPPSLSIIILQYYCLKISIISINQIKVKNK